MAEIYLVNAENREAHNAVHSAQIAAILIQRGLAYCWIPSLEWDGLAQRLNPGAGGTKTGGTCVVCVVGGIGNPCFMAMEPEVLSFIRKVKNMCPQAVIVMDGVSATVRFRWLLDQGVDIALRGESDLTFANVIDSFICQRNWRKIQGIAYLENSRLKDNGYGQLLDLNNAPLPLRRMVIKNKIRPESRFEVSTGRGCPFGCAICQPVSKNLAGAGIRNRPAKIICQELEEIIQEVGPHAVHFGCDTFTLNKQWVLELCQEIIDHNIKVPWSVGTRADAMDEEMAKAMKAAGCWEVGYGMEAWDEALRNDYLGKNLSLRDAESAVGITRMHGLAVCLTFIIGLPTSGWKQTLANLWGNLKIIYRGRPERVLVSNAVPIPGTDFYFKSQKQTILKPERHIRWNTQNFSGTNFIGISLFRILGERWLMLLCWALVRPVIALRKVVNKIRRRPFLGHEHLMRRYHIV